MTTDTRGKQTGLLGGTQLGGVLLILVSCSSSSSSNSLESAGDTGGSGSSFTSSGGRSDGGGDSGEAGGAQAGGASTGTGANSGTGGDTPTSSVGGQPMGSGGESIGSAGEGNQQSDADTSPDACYREPLATPEVPIVQVDGTRPELLGGEISDGRYELIKYELFGTPTGILPETHRQVLDFSEGSTALASVRTWRDGELDSWLGSVQINGAEMVITMECPDLGGAMMYHTFDVQGSLLLLGLMQGGVPILLTYRRDEDTIR